MLLVMCCFSVEILHADERPAFRTDGDPDDKRPWFQLVDGEFPPEGSAHYYSGELINVDHLKRRFVLRADRTDQQNRSHFDLPSGAMMLPYGSIYYHGAPAALEDIPLGTHLHGLFYVKDPNDQTAPLEGWHNRRSYEIDFTRCLRLEDDFSFYARQNQQWRIDELNLDEHKLTATLLQDGKTIGEPATFDLQASTRVWQGKAVVTQSDVATGQLVQLNMTWATLYGPGRLVELWIDDESRELVKSHQMARHHIYIRQRGLAGWVNAVDNKQRIVTITFFGGVNPQLFNEVIKGEQAGIAVSLESLMTYDPVNDRKRGPVLEIKTVPLQPGSSGVQIQVQPDLLLEGYRPGRIVRVYPGSWPVIALPREEQFFGQD
ncbi:MAG: hypothetical protein HQ518_01415 [Rhodopirellula sp.]|nr:hypothetical protein [Rhodopirellula sp.]